MSQQNDTGFLPIVAGAARAINLRVYNSSGTWTTADATHGALGVQLQASLAATDLVTIKSVAAAGTMKMVAAGPVSAGATVYAAAAGKVDASGTIIEGQALEAAGADGDVIEVVPVHNRDVSTATTGTTAATFQVDSDLGKPRMGLKSQTGGTGDFVAYLQAPATLGAARTFTLDGDADATICNLATTQTLTNKTLTSPVIGTQATGGAGSTYVPFIPLGANAAAVAPTAAIPITNFMSWLDSSGGATTQTLANGAIIGQLKKIQMAVAGNNDVVTPVSLSGGTTLTFNAVGEYVILVWNGTAWVIIESGNMADGDNDGPTLA